MRALLNRDKTTPTEMHLNVHAAGKIVGTLVGPGRNPNQLRREWTGYDGNGKEIGTYTGTQEEAIANLFGGK